MSNFTEKFTNLFKVNYDDDYEDDYFDDYDDFEEPPVKKTRNESSAEAAVSRTPAKRQPQPRKVVPMKKNSSGEVVVIKPTSYDEAREVVDTILSGRIVFLNLDGIHMELAQRIIDFIAVFISEKRTWVNAIFSAAPIIKLFGLAISGPKSVIAPIPKKISGG